MSLLAKGCRIAAVKAGNAPTPAGSRAASSDTGAPAAALKAMLFPGSTTGNPIDLLATGTADQLSAVLGYCDTHLTEIDAMAVIFGSLGLFPVQNTYDVLIRRLQCGGKPVFPILPSTVNTASELRDYTAGRNVCFPDEIALARAVLLVRDAAALVALQPTAPADQATPAAAGPPAAASPPAAAATPAAAGPPAVPRPLDSEAIRRVIDQATDGYLAPTAVAMLLDAANIARAAEVVVDSSAAAISAADRLGYPVVMKAVGPVHKSEVGGVAVGVADAAAVARQYARLSTLPAATAVLVQQTAGGIELFAGARREPGFGHLIVCGLGGVFVEVFRDIVTALAPLSAGQADRMINRLRALPILTGTRGTAGIDTAQFAAVIERLAGDSRDGPEPIVRRPKFDYCRGLPD